MPNLLKPLLRLALPVITVLLAIYAAFKFNAAILQYHEVVVVIPYVVLSIALLLALQFNCLRFFLTSTLLLLGYFAIQTGLQQSITNPAAHFLYTALSLALPVNLAAIALLPENGVSSRTGSAAIVLLLGQTAVIYWLYQSGWQIPPAYGYWLATTPTPTYLISFAGLGLFAGSSLLLLITLLRRKRETEALLLSCLLALFITLAFFQQPFISAVLIGTCGFILTYGVLHSSHDMAFRDDLTGLRNRRAFNDKLRSLGRKYVIATMDVDHFKKFNDTYGHDVGDDVLKLVAAKIAKVGGGGIPYRYGGEEFCIVFSGKTADLCEPHLEAVRLSIANYQMAIRNTKERPKSNKEGKHLRSKTPSTSTTSVTISIGVAERNNTNTTPELVLKVSDSALYRAKKAGRNCLVALQ